MMCGYVIFRFQSSDRSRYMKLNLLKISIRVNYLLPQHYIAGFQNDRTLQAFNL